MDDAFELLIGGNPHGDHDHDVILAQRLRGRLELDRGWNLAVVGLRRGRRMKAMIENNGRSDLRRASQHVMMEIGAPRCLAPSGRRLRKLHLVVLALLPCRAARQQLERAASSANKSQGRAASGSSTADWNSMTSTFTHFRLDATILKKRGQPVPWSPKSVATTWKPPGRDSDADLRQLHASSKRENRDEPRTMVAADKAEITERRQCVDFDMYASQRTQRVPRWRWRAPPPDQQAEAEPKPGDEPEHAHQPLVALAVHALKALSRASGNSPDAVPQPDNLFAIIETDDRDLYRMDATAPPPSRPQRHKGRTR